MASRPLSAAERAIVCTVFRNGVYYDAVSRPGTSTRNRAGSLEARTARAYSAQTRRLDARFPYIRNVIRKRSPTAGYAPAQLPAGADPAVEQLQDKLVALGYLPPRQADRLVGLAHGAPLDAVRDFQARHGLKPDRNVGGINSATRKALLRPADQLQRKS